MCNQDNSSCAIQSQTAIELHTNSCRANSQSSHRTGMESPIEITNHIHVCSGTGRSSALNPIHRHQSTCLADSSCHEQQHNSCTAVDISAAKSQTDKDVLRVWNSKFDQALQQMGLSVQELNDQLNGAREIDQVKTLPELMDWLDIKTVDYDIEIPDAPAQDREGDTSMSEAGTDIDTDSMDLD